MTVYSLVETALWKTHLRSSQPVAFKARTTPHKVLTVIHWNYCAAIRGQLSAPVKRFSIGDDIYGSFNSKLELNCYIFDIFQYRWSYAIVSMSKLSTIIIDETSLVVTDYGSTIWNVGRDAQTYFSEKYVLSCHWVY